jgi:citrate synthase
MSTGDEKRELKTLPPVPKDADEDAKNAGELKELDAPISIHREMELLAKQPIHKGLVNVVVDETTICAVDGLEGTLYYRGYTIQELVEKSTFEEVSFLLLFGKLPSQFELEMFREKFLIES